MSARFPTAQWFNELGGCANKCGRRAAGTLMSDRNEKIGNFCARCARHEIKQAHSLHRKHLPDCRLEEENKT